MAFCGLYVGILTSPLKRQCYVPIVSYVSYKVVLHRHGIKYRLLGLHFNIKLNE